MNNGIILFMLALFLAVRHIWRGLPEPDSPGMETMDTATLYRKKMFFRCGVLVCSALALLGMYFGESRVLPLTLMIIAGLCQFGAMRQNTKAVLTSALQKTMCSKTD